MFAAVLAMLAGCAPGASSGGSAQPPVSEKPVASQGTIVFDMVHGEVFSPEDTTELGQSGVVSAMGEAGYEVRVNRDTIATSTLEGAAALYVPGPMRPFTAEEQAIVDDYVARGGTVILSIHVPFPVLSMPTRWGLPVGTAVMESLNPIQDRDTGVFVATGVAKHEVTDGVKRVMVVSGWPVSVDEAKLADASLVVTAGPGVVVDGNRDRAITAADPQPPFGVIGVAPVGSGRVIVLGDDAIFANIAVNAEDNPTLLRNILKLIGAPRGV